MLVCSLRTHLKVLSKIGGLLEKRPFLPRNHDPAGKFTAPWELGTTEINLVSSYKQSLIQGLSQTGLRKHQAKTALAIN